MNRRHTWLKSLLLGFLVLTAGCTSLTPSGSSKSWKWPWSKPDVKESEYGVPTRMAVIWTPDVLNSPGTPPVRGFGGRIYFYDNKNQTIPVDGQLLVYGFNDSNPDIASTVPEKRFAFTPEQFTQHFSSTEIGASYSVWIPWDQDQVHKTVSLVPVFTSTQGTRVVGQPTLGVLRGVKTETTLSKDDWIREQARRTGVVPVGYEQILNPSVPHARRDDGRPEDGRVRIRTTTIPLSPNLGRQLEDSRAMPTQPTPTVNHQEITRNLEAYAALQRANQQPVFGANQPAMEPQARPEGSPPAHSSLQRFPVPTRPGERAPRDRAPWQRHPAELQSPHPYSQSPPALY